MKRLDLTTVRAIFDGFADPLILVDGAGNILRTNRQGYALFGLECVGTPIIHHLKSPVVQTTIATALAGQSPETVDLVLPDNIDHTYRVAVQPLYFSENTSTPRALITLHDITALRRSEQLRVDFLANASHELKTPLASLLGFIETMQTIAKDDPAAQEKFLGIMHAQATRMTRLVQDLLSLARIEFSEHLPPEGMVDMLTLARAAIDQLQPRAADRAITLNLHCNTPPPAIVGEADQLMQVLQNLIENAIKYTHEKTPVDITLAASAHELSLCVQDHGAGIDRHHLARMTERFYRVDTGRSRAAGGTGLGLSIVKHIVNRHRGRLVIESTLGEGTRFCVYLPLSPSV